MKAYRLTADLGLDGLSVRKGSLLLLDEVEAEAYEADIEDDVFEPVPDGTPISIPASRTEPV